MVVLQDLDTRSPCIDQSIACCVQALRFHLIVHLEDFVNHDCFRISRINVHGRPMIAGSLRWRHLCMQYPEDSQLLQQCDTMPTRIHDRDLFGSLRPGCESSRFSHLSPIMTHLTPRHSMIVGRSRYLRPTPRGMCVWIILLSQYKQMGEYDAIS